MCPGNESRSCACLALVKQLIDACGVPGIGLFLAYIGFQASEGIGVVTANPATLGTLGKNM